MVFTLGASRPYLSSVALTQDYHYTAYPFMTFMPRRQRNPYRRSLEVTAFDDAFCSFITPQTRAMRPLQTVDQEASSQPMNRLGLFRALQSEGKDSCLIKVPVDDKIMSDSSPINLVNENISFDAYSTHRRHTTPYSPKLRSSKSSSRSTTPGRYAKAEPIGDGPSIQGICMLRENGWEAVAAKTGVVIGQEFSSLLENSANKATASSPRYDRSSMGREDQIHSRVEKLQLEGGGLWNSASSSTSPEILPLSTIPGHITSICRGDQTCYPWLGDISANAESPGIENPGAWEMETGCGASFEGI
ncbi:hypothetical protein EDB81DRAFT_23587 [Dactylonectria macrodidyma]|uniref:Uncharacterized protein n=1 Tax=Dactylonectria macrodidyma TaxID=307937 RepID=A0A9P9FTN5_9HYPO|nr:hypothetical protein EDB81DRAFT_23587 [Dactylonectria macrodidyma]